MVTERGFPKSGLVTDLEQRETPFLPRPETCCYYYLRRMHGNPRGRGNREGVERGFERERERKPGGRERGKVVFVRCYSLEMFAKVAMLVGEDAGASGLRENKKMKEK